MIHSNLYSKEKTEDKEVELQKIRMRRAKKQNKFLLDIIPCIILVFGVVVNVLSNDEFFEGHSTFNFALFFVLIHSCVHRRQITKMNNSIHELCDIDKIFLYILRF